MKQTQEENNEPRTKVEELVEVILDENASERKVLVGALLEADKKERLVEFLKIIKMFLHCRIRTCPK